jgi:molybdenum cofactor guanylyltransferase
MRLGTGPIGVLLAGGRGRRMGGDKAGVRLAGRPLAQWPLDALTAVLPDVVVACRLDTELPQLVGVTEAWVEPDGPRGPVSGIISALREARGRSIVACSISLPLVDAATVRLLATIPADGRPAVVPEIDGRLEPLLARWEPSAVRILAGLPPEVRFEAAAAALDPVRVPFASASEVLTRVDAPEDLLAVGAILDARRRAQSALA